MYRKIFYFIYFLYFADLGEGLAIKIAPKVDFEDSETIARYEPVKEDYEIFKPVIKENPKPASYLNTIVINQNIEHPTALPSLQASRNDEEVNIVCKNKICNVYGFENEATNRRSPSKKPTSDVSVIISTNIDETKNKKEDDGDVPIIKGYKGVRPEDINLVEDDDEANPKNGDEQPSVIVTNPYSDGPAIINSQKKGVQKPILFLKPPEYQPSNWRGNVNWKTKIPNIDRLNTQYYLDNMDRTNTQYYHHNTDTTNTQYYHDNTDRTNIRYHHENADRSDNTYYSRKDSSNTHHDGSDRSHVQFYHHDNVQGSGSVHGSGYGSYETYNRGHGVRLPSGWSSNWKPSIPMLPVSSDEYHYNVNGKGNDFSGWSPRYVTVCNCSKKPVYGGGPQSRGDGLNPWYGEPETTTKMKIDDKLSPPFSKTQKNN